MRNCELETVRSLAIAEGRWHRVHSHDGVPVPSVPLLNSLLYISRAAAEKVTVNVSVDSIPENRIDHR